MRWQSNAEYRQQLAHEQDQYRRARFRARFAPAVWDQWDPMQRELAYQNDLRQWQLSRPRWTFWRVVGAVVVAFVLLMLVLVVL
jgi:hypothetical protein